jgi:hypothetical protein
MFDKRVVGTDGFSGSLPRRGAVRAATLGRVAVAVSAAGTARRDCAIAALSLLLPLGYALIAGLLF